MMNRELLSSKLLLVCSLVLLTTFSYAGDQPDQTTIRIRNIDSCGVGGLRDDGGVFVTNIVVQGMLTHSETNNASIVHLRIDPQGEHGCCATLSNATAYEVSCDVFVESIGSGILDSNEISRAYIPKFAYLPAHSIVSVPIAQYFNGQDTLVFSSVVFAERVGSISMIELISNPHKFHGKILRTVGYIHFGGEHFGIRLYFRQEDYDNRTSEMDLNVLEVQGFPELFQYRSQLEGARVEVLSVFQSRSSISDRLSNYYSSLSSVISVAGVDDAGERVIIQNKGMSARCRNK